MSQQPAYAIRCSTEEQAREVGRNRYTAISSEQSIKWYKDSGYPIITYSEAKEMGLLGEKEPKGCSINSLLMEVALRQEPQQNEVQELQQGLIEVEQGETTRINPNGETITEELLEKTLYKQESPSEDNLVEFAIRLKERFPSTPIKEILIEVKKHLLYK